MGSILGGSSQKTSSSSAPWAPQQPYLMQGFQNAQNVYNAQSQWGPYPGGSLYSAMTPQQLAAARTGAQYAAGTGQGLVNQTAGTAGTLQGLIACPVLHLQDAGVVRQFAGCRLHARHAAIRPNTAQRIPSPAADGGLVDEVNRRECH